MHFWYLVKPLYKMALKGLVYYPKPNNNKAYEGINIKH